MLEIEQVSWKNFLSYGDYVTTLDVGKLGQCLITGEIEDEGRETYGEQNSRGLKKSNGAGKTTIISVMQWVLFGRTSHDHNPGDDVINWFVGQDCWGQVKFRNGDSITRTRNYNGHNELIYVREGSETRLNCDTVSTSRNQQRQLSKIFGLDWEIFNGSTFFSQYAKPWMEMADQSRKKALERLLHVDRFSYYADVAKRKCQRLDGMVEKGRDQQDGLGREINRLEIDLARLADAQATFATNQQTRKLELLKAADDEIAKRDQIQLPDLDKLQARWDLVKKVEEKLSQKQQQAAGLRAEHDRLCQQANGLDTKISKHQATIAAVEQKVRLWREKSGKLCTACEQSVPDAHVGGKIEPLQEQMAQERAAAQTVLGQQEALRQQAGEQKSRHQSALAELAKIGELLTSKKPAMGMAEAKAIHSRWEQHNQEATRLRQHAERVLAEENPHDASIAAAKGRIEECCVKIATVQKDTERSEFLNRHYSYIHKAYNDRTKVKSLVFGEHIPYLNARLRHYLDVFGLDVKIELTDSLGIKSNMWGYKYESGGERKRTDVAFMLATFDFHEYMYGRQCNVLVMDEVDGRLDDDGIDALTNIIKNDIATRVETLLIVSHRQNMYDTFPRQIVVKRNKERMSRVEMVL